MAGVTLTTYTSYIQAEWAADFISPERLLPGGARVDPAAFTADSLGRKFIAAGTMLGRTYAERDAGTGYGPVDPVGDNEMYLLAFDVTDAVKNPDCDLLRHGTLVKENYLPGWSGLAANVQAAIRANYQTTIGTP